VAVAPGRPAPGRPAAVVSVLDVGRPAWHAQAACAGTPAEWWFPTAGDAEAIDKARAVCAGCPVRQACLDHALAAEPRYGVWAGTTVGERQRLRARRAAAGPA